LRLLKRLLSLHRHFVESQHKSLSCIDLLRKKGLPRGKPLC
jgi:hypothetical protein